MILNKILCPKCKSDRIVSNVLAHGYVEVDMQTGDIMEMPDYCEYDVEDIDDLICNKCSHKWYVNIPVNIYDIWENEKKLQEYRWQKRYNDNAKIKFKNNGGVTLKFE